MTTLNHQQQAQMVALQRAVERLRAVDLTARCAALGLHSPSGQSLGLRAFGQDLCLTLPDFTATRVDGKPVRLTDHLLVLHYLLCDLPLSPTGQMINFRDLAGGQFYFGPFSSRTTRPLVNRIGNNLDLLRANLGRFDTPPCNAGVLPAVGPAETPPLALSVRIHALGRIDMTLLYHGGDEEGPPTAELLFDACIKRVFATEDVAVLASRICLGLL